MWQKKKNHIKLVNSLVLINVTLKSWDLVTTVNSIILVLVVTALYLENDN